jgi:hypothetical protein
VIDPGALERKFTLPERNRAMVREFRDVLTNGFTDAQGVLRKPLIGKTIVFAVNKRHAETLANMFDQAFADQKPSPDVRFADYVVSGAGTDDTADGHPQAEFEERCRELMGLGVVQARALQTAERAFASILAKSFGG